MKYSDDAVLSNNENSDAQLILDALNQSGNLVALLEVADTVSGLCVIKANDVMLQLLNRSAVDIKGFPADFLCGDDGDAARLTRLRAALHTNMPLQETISVQVGGRQAWIGLRLMPVAHVGSGPRKFVLLGRDITDRRRRADADEAMQLLLGQAFRQAGIAMAVVEAGGNVMMSNYQFHTLCGRSASTIDGHSLAQQCHPDDVPHAIALREQQLADRLPYETKLRVVRPDGEVWPVRLQCNLIEHRNLQRLRIVTLTPIAAVTALPAVATAGPTSGPISRSLFVAGAIRLIGLEEVRQALGERWPALAKRAIASAEHVLRRHLSPGESFSRQLDGIGFVVCFAGATVEDSERRAAMITREIRTRLLGEMDDPKIAATALALDPQVLTPEELAEPAEKLAYQLEQRLKERRVALEERARNLLATSATGARCILIPVTTPAGARLPVSLVDLPRTLRRDMDIAMLTLPEAEMRGFDPTLLRLERLLDAVMEHGEPGRATNWILPIDFDTLTMRHRRERCLEQLTTLPMPLRQRLTLVLSQLPRSVYQARVDDALRLLKNFGRVVGIEINDLDALPFEPKAGNVGLVVVTGPMLSSLLRRHSPTEYAARMQQLRVKPVRVLARDAAGLSAADLVRLGVDLLVRDGDAESQNG